MLSFQRFDMQLVLAIPSRQAGALIELFWNTFYMILILTQRTRDWTGECQSFLSLTFFLNLPCEVSGIFTFIFSRFTYSNVNLSALLYSCKIGVVPRSAVLVKCIVSFVINEWIPNIILNIKYKLISLFAARLHAVAAEHAIEATKQFFEELRTTVGDDIFARFLNLQALRTLALVIDDTGSMGGRSVWSYNQHYLTLRALKEASKKIIFWSNFWSSVYQLLLNSNHSQFI